MDNSTMNKIATELKGIFKQRFEMDLGDYNEEALDKELLGYEFNMQPRDLLYLFFDIEKEFGITIPQEDIAEGRFNTFNNIAVIIADCLQSKEKQVV